MIGKTLDTREMRKKEHELRTRFNRAIKAVEALALGEITKNIVETLNSEYSDRLKAAITEHISQPSAVKADPLESF